MYGSPTAPSKDLNLPFPPVAPFNNHRKEESDIRRHQNHQMSSGLLRYRSAPSSLLGEVCEDFLPVRPSSPETETMFARFLAPDLREEIRDKPPPAPAAGGGGRRSPQFPPPAASAAAEESIAFYQHPIPNQNSADNSFRVVSSMAMESDQLKNSGNCSNLLRQSSSPAGLFSHLNVENGYGVMRGIGGGFRNGNGGAIGETGMGTGTRLKGQLSFSSRQSSSAGIMSQISEMESEGLDENSTESGGGGGGGGRCYIPGYPIGSWEDSALLSDNSFSGLRRARENQSEHQNGELRNGIAHQFSLPKTASEMAAIEKFLQFQDSVPCKIRAKRGCATHPRSIAERVRRTRISERMRKLQELVPNMDKQTNTADMLDLAVDYIKDLQKQVKTISDSRASCTCSSSKHKPYPNQPA